MKKLMVAILVAMLVLFLIAPGVQAKPDMNKPHCQQLMCSWSRSSPFMGSLVEVAEVNQSSRQPLVC